jgi:hypothetical protein
MSVGVRLIACLLAVGIFCSRAEGWGTREFSGVSGIASVFSPRTAAEGMRGERSSISPNILPPEFRVSYMNIRGSAVFDLGDSGGFLLWTRHNFDFVGVSAELSQRAFLSKGTGVFGNASCFVPTSQTIAEELKYLMGSRHFDWSMGAQLWTVGGGIIHNVSNSLMLVAGANYASFDLKFVEVIAGAGVGRMINPESFCEARCCTPYFGVVVNQNSYDSQLNAGLLLSPAIFGTMEYYLAAAPVNSPSRISGKFRNGRFCVLTLEYARNIPWGNIGGFIRWTPVRGEYVLTFNKNPTFPVNLQDGAKVTFNAQVLNAGIKCVLPFNSPF